MTTTAYFRQQYADLHDEELIQTALTRELIPEAQQALGEELLRRGISDLSAYKALMDKEAAAEEENRQMHIANRAKISGWLTWTLYALGLTFLLYGIFRAFVPRHSAGDESILIGVGIAIVVFAWIRGKISRMWDENVLFRKPPR